MAALGVAVDLMVGCCGIWPRALKRLYVRGNVCVCCVGPQALGRLFACVLVDKMIVVH